MATERFLHMRLSREDCANLDALVERMNRDEKPANGRPPHVGRPRQHHSQSDVVRLAIAEALLRRFEERV
ncbi:MAG: hypothetical protein OXC25_11420 [Thiotrichales bacterium]|nr:hypothetical protein [Thiotrichales bacterium]